MVNSNEMNIQLLEKFKFNDIRSLVIGNIQIASQTETTVLIYNKL